MFNIFKRLKLIEWIQIFLCLILIVVQVWLDLKLPDYMKEITTLIQTNSSSMKEIWIAGGYMMLCAFGSLTTAIFVSFIASKISTSLAKRLRFDVYSKVQSFSMEEIGNFSTASLITRSTNDVRQVQGVIAMGVQVLIKAPILAVWAILKISGKSWQWSLATGCAVFLMATMLCIIVIFAIPKFKIIQKLTDKLNGVTRENLNGVRVVRAYNAEKYQENKFNTANSELSSTYLFTTRIMAIISPGMSLILNGLSLSIYWIGAFLIYNATDMLSKIDLFADMVVYISYAMQVVMAFMMLIMFCIMLPRAIVSAKRINEVLNTVPKIVDGKLEYSPSAVGEVEFKNVSFKYPNAQDYVLQNVSFKANKGETIAFIGSTGSGKSTLINLIPRFYDATEGQVLIDGVDIKDYKQKDIHNKIGYISQKAVIFSGTIASNISFGETDKGEINEKDMINASKIAQAESFVEKMEEKYSSHIAQGGTNLSGGQKQRLAIARAVAKKPEIFIFDDSFSALDYRTDKKLRKELELKTKESTKFIVAQRIGTIRNANKIIVLEKGKVVGIGTHEELLTNCDVYKEIALSQLSEEELING